MRNDAARRLFAPCHDACDLRQFIVNWDACAGHLIRVLHREASQGSRSAAALRVDILIHPGIAPASLSGINPRRMRLTADFDEPQIINGPYGQRRSLYMTGGRLEREQLSGKVLPRGAIGS